MPAGPSDADSLVGRSLSGRFEITGTLGHGGAGVVYRAIQRPLGREVAVKVMRPDLAAGRAAEYTERFLREAALAGRLQHPNVVTVHDFGDDGGVLYVVMELLEGRTLAEALRGGPLPAEECARIGLGVARGLRHAHERGLVHRDVKPQNVMLVADDDGREVPKLLDFGLVKDLGEHESVTRVGQYLGTPAFLSPEQARGAPVDARADVYALGVMLFRMLTGRLPFEAEHPLGMALAHQSAAVPPMAEVAPNVPVPSELELVVRRALEKDPADRFPDAAAFADALERWLSWNVRPGIAPSEAPARGPMAALAVALGTGALVAVALLLVAVGVGGIALGWFGNRAASTALAPPEEPPIVVGPLPGEPFPEPPVQGGSPPAPAPSTSAPAPVPALAPIVAAPARTAPSPGPSPAPGPAGGLVVDDVPLTEAQGRAIVAFVNRATPDELAAAGVYDQGVGVILQRRPFATVETFGATKGIGTKTIEVLRDAAGREVPGEPSDPSPARPR